MRLDDQAIVVTGANSGLGREMANAFLEEGATVVFADLPDSGIRDAVETLSNPSGVAYAVEADVRSWEQVRALIRTAVDRCGGIDVLVNNAGIRQLSFGDDDRVQNVPIGLWEDIIRTNLTGTFLCTKATLPHMLANDSGRLIHLTSGHWPDGRALAAPYCASKFGIEGFARSLASELEDTGVQSLLLEPGGAVDTNLVAHLDESKRAERMDPSVIADPAVRLATGDGTNGGRYVATELRDEADW